MVLNRYIAYLTFSFCFLSSSSFSKQQQVFEKIQRNKATYAVLGAHGIAFGSLMMALVNSQEKIGMTVSVAIAYYIVLGHHIKGSYFRALEIDREIEHLEQSKILNSADWFEKNGVLIDGVIYKTGSELWQGYQAAAHKRRFLQHFLACAGVDSSVSETRRVILASIEKTKAALVDCSRPNDRHYSNAGLLLGKFFYRFVYPDKPYPTSISTWLCQEDRGGDFFKQLWGEKQFEHWLEIDFLTKLGIYESDLCARIFSLSEDQKDVAGVIIPWYRMTSWSKNSAARYYVVLLKKYIFLLACRALCDEMIAARL